MHDRVMNLLAINGSLHDMRYGFRLGRTCEHALLKKTSLTFTPHLL